MTEKEITGAIFDKEWVDKEMRVYKLHLSPTKFAAFLAKHLK